MKQAQCQQGGQCKEHSGAGYIQRMLELGRNCACLAQAGRYASCNVAGSALHGCVAVFLRASAFAGGLGEAGLRSDIGGGVVVFFTAPRSLPARMALIRVSGLSSKTAATARGLWPASNWLCACAMTVSLKTAAPR